MKKLLLLCLAISGTVWLSSCKKKETTNTPGNPSTNTNSLSYKRNGTSVIVNSVTTALTPMGGVTYIAIAGNSSTVILNLWITKTTSTGTFPLGFIGSDYVLQFSTTSPLTSFGSSDNGNIVISKHDAVAKEIEGSFQGTVYNDIIFPTDSVIISDGVFKVKYN
jgi:hypothetical protein